MLVAQRAWVCACPIFAAVGQALGVHVARELRNGERRREIHAPCLASARARPGCVAAHD
jgi:hypothetical protein